MSKPKGYEIDNAQLIQLLAHPPQPKRYRLWVPVLVLFAIAFIAHVVRS